MMRLWLKVSAAAEEENRSRPTVAAAVKVINPVNTDFIVLLHPLTGQAVL